LILPLIITTLGATLVAQLLGGQPIYTELLRRKVREQKLRIENSPSQ
ncbi:ClC family H(+)/Cl(-) exchange transporter, partial [Salinivibrio sp. VYel6]|nr:ClC family H(+)/Cl(-) exchange transporter [Salinivibrio sp. VYel6]